MSIVKATSARTPARRSVVPSPHGLIRRIEVVNLHARRGRGNRLADIPRVLRHMLTVAESDAPQ